MNLCTHQRHMQDKNAHSSFIQKNHEWEKTKSASVAEWINKLKHIHRSDSTAVGKNRSLHTREQSHKPATREGSSQEYTLWGLAPLSLQIRQHWWPPWWMGRLWRCWWGHSTGKTSAVTILCILIWMVATRGFTYLKIHSAVAHFTVYF